MKKNWILSMMAGVLFVFTGLGWAYAREEENKMDEVSSKMDKESRGPGEARRVEERLEKKFNVTDARIDSLRKQGLGYGEIGTTLSLASRMPGGINDQNIQKVMDLRQGQGGHKEGWGKIAGQLGMTLKPSVRDMDDVHQARREDGSEQRRDQRERPMEASHGHGHAGPGHHR
ncbi:MAG: hypothetical protein HY591_00605 [Candidatus Omnitrophica bacterium]|nr:hypothetical protein [Candidatus Omnitrophota bacterium]